MKKITVLITAAILLFVIIGVSLAFRTGSEEKASTNGGGTPATGYPVELRQRIVEAEDAVTDDPKNTSAWVQLGNLYFDAGLPARAVSAYDKALELKPNDPDVLTDQGISCRQIGWYDKAVADFEQVLKIDPNHEQSLVNLGIVFATDLKQPKKALDAWRRFLEINPSSPASNQVRLWVKQLEADPEGFARGK